ncbi:MAG: hypothetical protein APF84_19440 [Gracilibacter sp. BRH_c7a]|nr:MAG: hypothetical protein APF84_19440 [Gracilibacter sp. BRH_c7a]
MYLTENSILSVAMKQYRYKLRSYLELFSGLFIMQILGLVLSLGAVSSYSSSSNILRVSVMNYHSSIIMIFTFMWIFALSIILTTRQYRNLNYTFVANRLSSLTSDIGFILTSCILGGLTASLHGMLLRVIIYFSVDNGELLPSMFKPSPSILFTGITAAILYMMIIGAVGYLFGLLVQTNKLFAVLIPALFFAAIRMYIDPYITDAVEFYIKESSLTLFAGKVIVTVFVFFLFSMITSTRMEVRR